MIETRLRVFGSMGDKHVREICHEAANEIERQAAQIEQMREALKESGRLYCTMIGNDFINQPSMFERSVVAKYVRGWFRHNQPSMVKEALSTTPDQALEQFAERVREQCAKACDAQADHPECPERAAYCAEANSEIERKMDAGKFILKQLAECQAALVDKHNSLEAAYNRLRWWMDAFPHNVTEADNEEMLKIVKALAATADLEGLVLCEGEPVAWTHSCNVLCLDGVELWIDRCPHCGKPASAAREQK